MALRIVNFRIVRPFDIGNLGNFNRFQIEIFLKFAFFEMVQFQKFDDFRNCKI